LSSRRDFLEVWIVVALAQQSLIQIKIDLAGPKRLEFAADPIFGEVWLSARVGN